jgi:glutathione S-transferase
MLKLHTFPLSPNTFKVTSVLHHLGLDFEMAPVDLPAGETHQPAYLALNPNAMVPTLVDGDLTLWESHAIMVYLAEKHGSDLMPTDVRERAEVNRWLCWGLAQWNTSLGPIAFERLAPSFIPGYQTDQAAVDKAMANLKRFAPVLNEHLKGRQFVAVDRVTVADYALAAMAAYRRPSQAGLEEYPEIERWLALVEALPAWQKTVAPLKAMA